MNNYLFVIGSREVSSSILLDGRCDQIILIVDLTYTNNLVMCAKLLRELAFLCGELIRDSGFSVGVRPHQIFVSLSLM